MSEPERARAYVAPPVTAESGVFPAIRWAFALNPSLTWNSIGLIVPDAEREQRLSHLHRMRSRGVRIGTIDQALTARSFSGVMIAYRPDPQVLAQTQDAPGVVGVMALAADRRGLQPWVDAYHPEHLGGAVIAPNPVLPQSAVLEGILGSHTSCFTTRTGTLAPHELQLLTEALRQAHRHGCHCAPDGLMAAALRAGWPGHAAWALHTLASAGLPDTLGAPGSEACPPEFPRRTFSA